VTLEHSGSLPSDQRRTAVFARYSLVGSLVGALGSLAAGLPAWAASTMGVPVFVAIQYMFVAYAGVAGLAALIYRGLPRTLGAEPATVWRCR
jgi:hypothetical protein